MCVSVCVCDCMNNQNILFAKSASNKRTTKFAKYS